MHVRGVLGEQMDCGVCACMRSGLVRLEPVPDTVSQRRPQYSLDDVFLHRFLGCIECHACPHGASRLTTSCPRCLNHARISSVAIPSSLTITMQATYTRYRSPCCRRDHLHSLLSTNLDLSSAARLKLPFTTKPYTGLGLPGT